MAHRITHKKLSRDTNARRALLKNLATSLVLHERIVTTIAKAKAVRPFVEKLVTRAREDSLPTRRYLSAKLDTENAAKKMIELIGPTFKERPGGYTRIIKLAPRAGDNAKMAVLEFVENVSEVAAKEKIGKKKPKAKEQKVAKKKPAKVKEKAASEKTKKPAKNKRKESKNIKEK